METQGYFKTFSFNLFAIDKIYEFIKILYWVVKRKERGKSHYDFITFITSLSKGFIFKLLSGLKNIT